MEEIPSILYSPLVLGEDVNDGVINDNSYHTPLIASSSLPPSSLAKSNKENLVVLYDSWESHLVEIIDDPAENVVLVPVCKPSLDFSGISQLITVYGQRASRTMGHPKLVFHPYAFCCCLGRRSSTHQPGNLCLCLKTEDREPSL